jgi:hypothetical protein
MVDFKRIMSNKKIQISVSKLNQYQQYLLKTEMPAKNEDGTTYRDENGKVKMTVLFPDLETLFSSWLEKSQASQAMAVGTAVHLFIETGGECNVGQYGAWHGFQAPHDQGFDIFIPDYQLTEVKQFVEATKHAREAEVTVVPWEFEIDGFQVVISGKIDGKLNGGQLLEDHKVSTSKWNPAKDWDGGKSPNEKLFAKFDETVQHDFYMCMAGAEKFAYNQFWFRPANRGELWSPTTEGCFILAGQAMFERKPALVPTMKEYFEAVMHDLIQTGFADKLAKKQAFWIEKRWPEKTWKV